MGRGRNSELLHDPVPEFWRQAAEIEKSLLGWLSWPAPEGAPHGMRVPAGRNQLRTVAGETISAVVPLKEKSGPGLEGVRLRLTVWAFRREVDVTATLEVPDNRFVTIA